MDVAALAKEVAEEEGLSIPNSDGKGRGHLSLQSLGAFARGYEALVLRNKYGKEWHEIAEELGFKSAAVAYRSALAARKKLDFESKDDLRFRQRSRLAELYDALQPAIKKRDKFSPRAIEVAVKILEREARLEGLDLEGAAQEQGTKAIIINVQPHPNDKGAREIATDDSVLQTPAIDVPFEEEVHLPDRRNGIGKNMERPLLGTGSP
jgi:hypothetical protein